MKTLVNIFLIGPMGAGKSTIGKQLAQSLNFEFFDSDDEIIKRTGADLVWIFDLEGEKGYRKREDNIIEALSQKKGIVLATGGGAVLSEQSRKNIASRGTVIYLRINLKKQYKRLEKDKKRPLLQDKTDLNKTLETLESKREPYYQQLADIIVDTNIGGVQKIVDNILEKLEEKRF